MDSKISALTNWPPSWTDITNFVQWWVDKSTTFNNIPISTATQTALNAKQNLSEKWQANWYASLDWSWKVPTSQLPPSIAWWDMLKSVYDPDWWEKQVAFKDEVQSLVDNLTADDIDDTSTTNKFTDNIEKNIWNNQRIPALTWVNNPIAITQWTWNTFSITDWTWYINDNWTITPASWTWKTNIVDLFPNNDVTFIFIDATSNVIQLTAYNPIDKKNKIQIGAIGKDVNWNIVFFKTISNPNFHSNTFLDALGILGNLQNGKMKILWTADLSLNLVGWKIFSLWSNMFNTTDWPNFTAINSANSKPFKMVYRNGTWDWIIWAEQTLLTPELYDNGTLTLATVWAWNFQNMTVYISTTWYIYIQYWQTTYWTLANARDNLTNEVREDWNYWTDQIVKLAHITIRRGATATNNTSQCLLTNLWKFGTWGSWWWSWWVTDHNLLTGLQWWTIWEYFHLTQEQLNLLNNQSWVNTGDQDLSWLALKSTTITINWDTQDLDWNLNFTVSWWASFDWVRWQVINIAWEIVPWKIAELTAFASWTFAEMQISTLTRTTWTTTVSLFKNWVIQGSANIISSTPIINGRYFNTSSWITWSFVANDVITISVTDNWTPWWTNLVVNLK